ncbi:PHB depolymerase family esterase [Palleronia sp. LCG004]|uniref:extracellular catalytic domain type 1 short-chain-length polyhydroxyalkanoate depolymerase n=1 Tax=Palleronia sp. LCG004 TaxID=3079304 RepID=UPI002943DDEA|nr:PHB depolymerase family esterase [Palleronia sp. LCG004]WOI57762.1 PHB depolymerase family esterase [Palleronia sp. LCG004]
MNNDLATALGRALRSTRAGDPAAATAYIRTALSGRTAPMPRAEEPCGPCARMAKPAGLQGGMPDFSGLPGMDKLPGMGSLPGMADLPGRNSGRKAPVPDGATVSWRKIAGRDVRLFIPSERAGGPVGLVLMLHGCTQSPEDFALGTRMDQAAEAAGYAVAYPGQTGAQNMQSCWNWFRAQDQGPDAGEPAILASIAREISAELNVEGRVFAAGLSAGGAMAAVLAETHPDLFVAVGVHSGIPAGAASDMVSAFSAMRGERAGRPLRRPGIVFHGTADGTVSPANAKALIQGNGVETRDGRGARSWSRLTTEDGSELWLIDGAGHAWSGGDAAGSYADATGPDASAEMIRFFGEVVARG